MGIIINTYRKNLIHRYDDNHIIKYFSADDFPGLMKERAEFWSNGNKLIGYYYYYPDYDDRNVVVFCHGLLGGHRSYMVEIEKLAKAGFMVFAYDMTGTFESGGDSIVGVSQSLRDLDCAINYLKDNGVKNIYAIGHSCGGFAVQNITCFHPNISKIISISGFVSLSKFFDFSLKGLAKLAKPFILNYEKQQNPLYSQVNSTRTLNETKAKVLIVHSEDDPTVGFESDIGTLRKSVKNTNIEYMVVNGKKHNPNYTVDAVNYMAQTMGSFKGQKDYFKNTDWYRMTAQDEEFWNKALEFLRR